MYKGKHTKCGKYSRRRSNRKAAMLLSALVLTIGLIAGTTVAFLIASDDPITNVFNPSTVSIQVEEDPFDKETKKNVTIANTGDTEVYIRAAIVVTWQDEAGNVYAGTPVAGEDYNISLNESDWFLANDGFYYYKNPVDAGSSTIALINECTAVEEKTPAGYGLNVEILGSAIQSVPTDVVAEKWGVTVGTDGTLSE